jgi:hypothetical protein
VLSAIKGPFRTFNDLKAKPQLVTYL